MYRPLLYPPSVGLYCVESSSDCDGTVLVNGAVFYFSVIASYGLMLFGVIYALMVPPSLQPSLV